MSISHTPEETRLIYDLGQGHPIATYIGVRLLKESETKPIEVANKICFLLENHIIGKDLFQYPFLNALPTGNLGTFISDNS